MAGEKKQEEKPKTRECGDPYVEGNKEDGSMFTGIGAALVFLGEFTKNIDIST